ncbi:uncharacterized protein HD556DRAFT_226488 [Suillus plorans]|uniref:Uncharacterized protein n=1 Tax=Suillus plorans TaxID=116603 RepID=A0A9P7DM47_9AGAM|nr:uncharacterized protein HD556DRAFT_226488 [Suillus plorans]KAG1798202.1 hypothetical protein HD556DRAFT_226488 [Suillus plorans]
MFTSLDSFAVYLALISSVLGAAIPTTTVTTTSTSTATSTYSTNPHDEVAGALWKNNVHDKVYSSEASTEAIRRSVNLWRGIEHDEVAPVGRTPSRRSGEIWHGLEHRGISVLPDV